MTVDSNFLVRVKIAIRVTDAVFDLQITDLIKEAILDLTRTANIAEFTTADCDQLQLGAVICWVQYKWFRDEKYLIMYNDIKAKMAVSSAYSNYEE